MTGHEESFNHVLFPELLAIAHILRVTALSSSHHSELKSLEVFLSMGI